MISQQIKYNLQLKTPIHQCSIKEKINIRYQRNKWGIIIKAHTNNQKNEMIYFKFTTTKGLIKICFTLDKQLIYMSQIFEITEIQFQKMSENKITIGIKIPLNKAVSQPNVPIKIDNYSYFSSDEIGLGYISHVYLGRNDHTNEIVAIKVMDISKEDELGQQLIQEEINILSYIKSHKPNHLLLLHDYFQIKNYLYIVTQYCEGKDIAKTLRKKKLLSEAEAQSVMKQLMKAYKEIYDMKIIHRDLKLSNILVQKGKIKLADFGFSIKLDKYQQEGNSYNVGSPYYMPPETLKLNKYSFKSDIWALGVMAYEMVYGKLPWKEKVQSILHQKIIKTHLEQIFDSSITVSEHYKAFIRSCLQVQAQRRATPQSIIGYVWPLAYDSVEGCPYEPNNRPMSMLQQLGSVTKRQIVSHHFIHQSSNRSNHNSFSKIQPLREKSPNFLNRDNQQAKTSMTSTVNLKELNDKPVSIYNNQSKFISKILVSQLNYCRFIQKVEQMLIHCQYSDGINLRYHLHNYRTNKLKQIYKLEKGLKCVYSDLPHLKQFKMTDNWQRLRQILAAFVDCVSNTHLNQDNNNSTKTQLIIIKAIRQLKLDLQRNFPFLQELTYLYQLKLLENRQNLAQFAFNSKIELLSNRTRQHFREKSNPQLYQRLTNKLVLLDL